MVQVFKSSNYPS